jgi:hypothetical protein
MSEFEARGANSSDNPDWNAALEAISRLLAGRGATLPQATDAPKLRQEPAAMTTPSAGRNLGPEHPAQPGALIAPDGLARDIAEIEQAAAVLKREEPRLEPQRPGPEAKAELRKARSVWILIAVIWLSVAAAVSCAIGAVLVLFG